MCGTLLPGIANLALISIPVSEAKIAFGRMFEFTAAEAEKDEDGCDLPHFENLQAQNLSFRFARRSPIIKDRSFEINKGEIIALMGENGCGKSTLTQILQKHYRHEAGKIIVNGNIMLESINTSL